MQISGFPGTSGSIVMAEPSDGSLDPINAAALRDTVALVHVSSFVKPLDAVWRMQTAGAIAVVFLSASSDVSSIRDSSHDNAAADSAGISIPVVVVSGEGASSVTEVLSGGSAYILSTIRIAEGVVARPSVQPTGNERDAVTAATAPSGSVASAKLSPDSAVG